MKQDLIKLIIKYLNIKGYSLGLSLEGTPLYKYKHIKRIYTNKEDNNNLYIDYDDTLTIPAHSINVSNDKRLSEEDIMDIFLTIHDLIKERS